MKYLIISMLVLIFYSSSFVYSSDFSYDNPSLPRLLPKETINIDVTTTTNITSNFTGEHNNLTLIQGGTYPDEYYHINQSIYDYLLNNIYGWLNSTMFDNGTIIRNNNFSNWVNSSGYILDWNSTGILLNYSDIISSTGGDNESFNQTFVENYAYSKTDISTFLSNYVNFTWIGNELSSYVNQTTLSTTLSSYVNTTILDNATIIRNINTSWINETGLILNWSNINDTQLKLDYLCATDGKILKRIGGQWVCAEDQSGAGGTGIMNYTKVWDSPNEYLLFYIP